MYTMMTYRTLLRRSIAFHVDDGYWKDDLSVVRVGYYVGLMDSGSIRNECSGTYG